MKRIISASLLVLLISSFAFAQTVDTEETVKSNCPDISVSGPPSSVAPGENQIFTLTIEGEYDKEKLEIKWTVNNGEIVSGQGTDTLYVKSLEEDATTTATVIVKTSEKCIVSASETGIPICSVPPTLFDEFKTINYEETEARIYGFLIELQNNPDATGYIINYGSNRHILSREKHLRDYFKRINFPLDRIVFVNGGIEKEIRTRVWIVSAGADYSIID